MWFSCYRKKSYKSVTETEWNEQVAREGEIMQIFESPAVM